MIFPLAGVLLGLVIGAFRARAKGGTAGDLWQWAAVHALIGGLLGLFLLIILDRSLA